MSRIVKVLLPLMVVATVFSCQHGSNSKSTVIVDSTVTDTFFIPDTLSEVDEEIEEADESDRLDASFDDFMFAFTHSDRLQSKRIVWPLAYIDAETGILDRVTATFTSGEKDFNSYQISVRYQYFEKTNTILPAVISHTSYIQGPDGSLEQTVHNHISIDWVSVL